MEVLDFETIPPGQLAASALTIGNFDGVHLGHRAIIAKVLAHAARLQAPAAALTFQPHPREVIFRGQRVPAILPFSERARLIAELGVALLVKVNFTPAFAGRTAADFVSDLVAKFHPGMVVIGHDFRFGQGREGDENFLRQAGSRLGFSVEAVPAVEVEGKPVSSSRIRALIQAGEMRRVRRLLGAPFPLEGEVAPGHGRGKGLGFATANLRWSAELIPPDGVYAAVAEAETERFPAVVNIGTNPTFGDQAVSIEAHLLGFQGELYSRRLRLAFYHRLRGEIKFSSAEALVAQIREDVDRAKEILRAEAGAGLFAGRASSEGRGP